jgi:signal transduction histidine kinase
VSLGIMTVASGGLGWFMSGRALRPVRVITETARRASEQHLGERLQLKGARDEVKELADTFDEMLDRLDTAFATQHRFVANASHELRTPLTVMRTAIDVTLAKPSPTARQLTDMAVRVRRSIDKAESMIEALLTLAVSDRGKLSTEFTDLATWAEDAIDAAAPEIERLNLNVEAKLDPAETTGDPQLLERMISNLVDNAVRHNEPGGWIRLHTGSSDTAVYLEIANSGPFIPDDKVPELFEPFRRMEARTGARDGTGLGLSIARDCLRMEAAPFGIDVVVIEPGGIRTEWSGIAADKVRAVSGSGPYAFQGNAVASSLTSESTRRRSSPPELIGKTITKAVTARRPRTRYAAGYGAKPMILLHGLLPDRTFDTFIRRATSVPAA